MHLIQLFIIFDNMQCFPAYKMLLKWIFFPTDVLTDSHSECYALGVVHIITKIQTFSEYIAQYRTTPRGFSSLATTTKSLLAYIVLIGCVCVGVCGGACAGVQVVFVGIRGENVFSDIAIDYVIIRPQSCDYSPPCTCYHSTLIFHRSIKSASTHTYRKAQIPLYRLPRHHGKSATNS